MGGGRTGGRSDVVTWVRRIIQRSLARLQPHLALIQLVGVVVCLPPLIFPTYVPSWAIVGSLVGLLLLLVGGHLLAQRPFVRTPVDVPILVLLLLLPVTLWITPDWDLTLVHVYKVIGSAALFYGVVGVLQERPWFGLTAWAIGALGLGLALFVLFGTEWNTAKFPWLPFDLYQHFPRLIRPFWNPRGFSSTIAGGTLAMLLPIPVAYMLFDRRLLVRLGALLEVGIVGLVLLFTQSRGAILAVLVGLMTVLLARSRRWLVVSLLLLIVGVLALQTGWLDGFMTSDTVVAAENTARSAQGRLELWSRGWMMLQDFPFTGIGFGLVVRVMPVLYPTFVVPNDRGVEHVHNLYLEAGVDLGFLGLIATLALIFGLCYFSWRTARRAAGTGLESLALGMLGGIVVFAVHGLTDDITFYAKAHFIAWALFGVAVAVGMRVHEQCSTANDQVQRPMSNDR